MCCEAFHRLLGIAKKRLVKMTHGQIGMAEHVRRSFREPTAFNLVDRFFAELYQSAAEPLPHGLDFVEGSDGPTLELGIVPYTGDQALVGMDPVPGTAVRHLPPGKPMDLYWQFLATWDAVTSGRDQPPSLETFKRCWRKKPGAGLGVEI